MRSRITIHEEFVARFHIGERPTPVSTQQLDAIEARLNTRFPAAYREFITRFGTVSTPHILDLIVDNKLEHSDIQQFLDPQQAIEGTECYWSGGMPEFVIGIASDCMGNMIGFRRQIGPSDDAPVIFFDHDFVEVSELAPSFDEFLAWYLDHLECDG